MHGDGLSCLSGVYEYSSVLFRPPSILWPHGRESGLPEDVKSAHSEHQRGHPLARGLRGGRQTQNERAPCPRRRRGPESASRACRTLSAFGSKEAEVRGRASPTESGSIVRAIPEDHHQGHGPQRCRKERVAGDAEGLRKADFPAEGLTGGPQDRGHDEDHRDRADDREHVAQPPGRCACSTAASIWASVRWRDATATGPRRPRASPSAKGSAPRAAASDPTAIATGRIQVGRAAIEANVFAGETNTPTSRRSRIRSLADRAEPPRLVVRQGAPRLPSASARRPAARWPGLAGGGSVSGNPSMCTPFHSRMSAIALWYADTALR